MGYPYAHFSLKNFVVKKFGNCFEINNNHYFWVIFKA